MSDDNQKRRRERDRSRDDFWTLDAMMPPKRQGAFSRDTDTVQIDIEPLNIKIKLGGNQTDTDGAEKHENSAIPKRESGSEAQQDKVREYEPVNPLIKKVVVRPWPSRYSFYNKFRDDARRFFDKTHAPCEPVDFFSYMPQFNQLSTRQLNWYLYWREQVKNGNFPETDYAYIVLFINELINLPERFAPSVGIVLMVSLWKAYRLKYTKLDALMTETVCDYCLINELSTPFKLMGPELSASALKIARFKEFYIRNTGDNTYANFLINQAGSYDYNTSRFITPENRELFDRHIRGAVERLLERGVFEPEANGFSVTQRYSRDSYINVLCCYEQHKRIDIEFFSYRSTAKLKALTTSVIRYSENLVRKILGINSKYKVTDLEPEVMKAIDEYFEPYIVQKSPKPKKQANEEPEYEKLYDVESDSLSPENAADIERSSWLATNALTEALNDEPQTDTSEPMTELSAPQPEPSETETSEVMQSMDRRDDGVREILSLLLDGKSLEEYACSRSEMPDSIADRINETLYPLLGDVALEKDVGGRYIIIEDYADELTDFVNKGAAAEQ